MHSPDHSLAPAEKQFPLGRSFVHGTAEPLRRVPPLGVTLAVVPEPVEEVDMTAVGYDPVRQIGIVRDPDGSLTELARHSTGWTHTDTASSDKRPGDSDQDATED